MILYDLTLAACIILLYNHIHNNIWKWIWKSQLGKLSVVWGAFFADTVVSSGVCHILPGRAGISHMEG
jgi:hypothetical protein